MLRRLMVLWLGAHLSATAAAGLPKAAPHLDSHGQAAYQSFLSAAAPRAFAIAPGGAHAWAAEAVSEEAAEEQALEACRRHSEQACMLFAVNGHQVFDGKR
ncbi:MAG: hypothetical protein KKG92_03505, partial [Gammaproteobacteria bacterium]|nr:hypothetical protein [Gammaproteobacteria bacterium]